MQSSDPHSMSRLREPLQKEDALVWPMREERTSQGEAARAAEGREGPQAKGRLPEPIRRETGMSLTP